MAEREEGFEPARRELCPDDSCIGLIGPDGRCKVCGTVGRSAMVDPRNQGMIAPDADAAGDDLDDDDRELCPDGACVGLIGSDGRCKVCGRTAEGAPAAGTRATTGALHATGAITESVELDFDDDERELCPDGSCIGLIGPDGMCKVCGTPRSSAPP
jgi:hypothetical protein